MTATATKTNRRLAPGTEVFSREDGEPGTIVRIATRRRNGVDAWSYLVDTANGRETWDASDCQVVTSYTATYLNQHTRETYTMGGEIQDGENGLSTAWNRCKIAAQIRGWNLADTIVKPGTVREF
jgi:hypothetical protein